MPEESKPGGGLMWAFAVAWLLGLLSLAYAAAAYQAWDGQPGPLAISIRVVGGLGGLLMLLGLGIQGVAVLLALRVMHRGFTATVANTRRLTSAQTTQEALLTQICENLLVSEAIKTVAFREKDREIMADAIRQDMRAEKWDSATDLIDELADRFGCRQLADDLRREMDELRQATREEKVAAAIAHVESLWIIHRYDDALQEAASLARTYGDDARIARLTEETERQRERHKKDLLDRLNKAVEKKDVDQGVEILKLLDGFLTPREAAALRESARDVFRAKLQKLGVEFSLFVTEKKWTQALKVGKTIIAEFPNSRMAEEVREKLDVLEQRAQGQL